MIRNIAMNKKISKWMTFAALLMFVGATFRITSDHFISGAVCFIAAASCVCSANVYRKKENEENQKEVNG